MPRIRSCVHPSGQFVYGLHRPSYQVLNQREEECIEELGLLPDQRPHDNQANFPADDLRVEQADAVYEIVNPLPFRGCSFITASWAAPRAKDPASIRLPESPPVSMHQSLRQILPLETDFERHFRALPEAVLLSLATNSTDPEDLLLLARISCELLCDADGRVLGLRYHKDDTGRVRPLIHHHDLFETLVNNPALPDDCKRATVLRPGAQGASEIVGAYRDAGTHVFEYLRRNSYIPWGHYAANMADDAVRYQTSRLSEADIHGLRHLYYQRSYLRLAQALGLPLPPGRRSLTEAELEALRLQILEALSREEGGQLPFTATLWGWNYGFDFSPSGYRLHASHQQIHQQYALLAEELAAWHHGGKPADQPIATYACGDLLAAFCAAYRAENGCDFFPTYLSAIRNNRRMDDPHAANQSLIIYEDPEVLLFVPKAQTSQWELQLMPLGAEGNILEADAACRAALDRGLLIGQKILAALGARMVTCIEYAKRFESPDPSQRLLYALLPKLPYAMGAFSEAQLRWISEHFPEDFAAACRLQLSGVLDQLQPTS